MNNLFTLTGNFSHTDFYLKKSNDFICASWEMKFINIVLMTF